MTSYIPPNFEALPNPRGAAVRPAEHALAEAQRAFTSGAPMGGALLAAARALGQAGWLPAKRFVDALVLASPFAQGEFGSRFSATLTEFNAVLRRRNLRELACSPTLFEHYRGLSAHIASHAANAFDVTYEDVALAGRPVAPATLRAIPAAELAQVRAGYERALLAVLRGNEKAVDELEGSVARLVGPDPYDVWRLVAGCVRALRQTGRAGAGDVDVKRFFARCNLLLGDQTHGLSVAPRSFVRAALALLWRDYALYGAAAEDADHVALLNDYGLTVDWHVAGTQASEALWEEGAIDAERAAISGAAAVREIGVLSVNAGAYEDFLQTADASMGMLARQAGATGAADFDAAQARRSSDAAYGLGAAAGAMGLGHIALLADALGLAWRVTAHALETGPAARAPEPGAIDTAAQALRAMLLRVAAGVAPSESSAALASLTQAIERTAPAGRG